MESIYLNGPFPEIKPSMKLSLMKQEVRVADIPDEQKRWREKKMWRNMET